MLGTKRLLSQRFTIHHARNLSKVVDKLLPVIPLRDPSQWSSRRFLDIYQFGNKAAIEKERARLKDEMNRGYFADISEMKQHGGKIAVANKIIVPAMTAMKFPVTEVSYPDGISIKLPITSENVNTAKSDVPKASVLCLSFRASSLAMVDSWSIPFLDAFGQSKNVQLYEVSFIDSWLLTRNPIKKILLRIMRKSKPAERNNIVQSQIVYSFGDHYDFRKELKILNLLTGYIYLIDKLGRIRWQGSGFATPDELSSLVSCTSFLLEEK
ncbi:mitochondrial ATPase complex subunit ATP10 isoform X1 [Olea europaea subsp. europaea]|uniref:Mitochondrial ATPase complex subunit ATP10 isoform X1 n=2 Tax=Olea europaea subsp. europaea TaxID=158383 RepID=A0A8S0VE84_OLEEU|nr:mitochondrial ATPase complex subunit ATP10 isoform X1 [Olea europaea subsp. europaea]